MYSSDDRDDYLMGLTPQTFSESTPLAYVRPVLTEKGSGFGVYSADGTQLAVFSSKDAAYFAAKQHDLEPVHIH